MKDIPEMRCAGKIFSSQCFYHWVDTSAGELLVPEGTNRPVASTSTTWVDTFAGELLVPESTIRPVVSVSITGSIPLLVNY